jgi:glycosyltransferase involved in cell wall biosynthesis
VTTPSNDTSLSGLVPGGEREASVAHAPNRREPSLEVMLATYNGEPFVAALLDSLFAQTHQAFTLVVSDDCSTDGTMRVLTRFAGEHPDRIRLLPPNPRRLGARENFARLVDHATADYIMLCDHDDVWLPDKIRLSLEEMIGLEAMHTPALPLLVHTDLMVVGPRLDVLNPSFSRYSGLDTSQTELTRLLTVNVCAGCTMIINRALYQRARPIPQAALMHDHWLALAATTLGAIGYIAEPTILYRQHERNAIGVPAPGRATLIRRIAQTLFTDDRVRLLARYSRQAAVLLARYGAEMEPEDRKATEALATVWAKSRWRRFSSLRRNHLTLRGLIRNVALFIVVARDPPKTRRAVAD